MVLVYDLRDDHHFREQILSRISDQWQAYLNGSLPTSICEGRIVRLFFANYEGEHRFLLDEGEKQSSWVRNVNDSRYVVGRYAKIESVVFCVADPIGDLPVVTRIWIGDGDGQT
jgi:hypothetical protein